MDFVNKSKYEFIDVSNEEWREYDFGGTIVVLKDPLKLAISESGHRVFTGDGISHYIPKGWMHLRWKAKAGAPQFVR